jgi:squalene-hopene/tetraprenyl-beta-curcumene cyclase
MLRSALCLLCCGAIAAADLPAKAEVAVIAAKAEAYLLAQQQPDGGFTEGARYALGITQLAAIGLTMPPGLPAADPRIVRAVAFMNAFSQPDGGLYPPDEGLGTYYTSLAVLAWKATGTAEPARLARARDYLLGVQETAAGIKEGGFGYGNRKGSEDLSNAGFAILALRAADVPAADPRMQAALRFLERCQDLSSVNQLPWAVGNSGGAVYTPDVEKMAGSWLKANPGKTIADAPKVQPYGTMTYQLIQAYAALELTPDDPRLQAALAWARANYRFDVNPGIVRNKGKEGLLYYYMGMAKTFGLLGLTSFEAAGRTVDWRADLFAAIRELAQTTRTADGGEALFWINEADRWGEGSPALATCYMVHALKRIHAALP